MKTNNNISKDQLDLFLEGKTSAVETMNILEAMVFDPSIQEYIVTQQRMSHTIDLKQSYGDFIPVTSLAADDGNNLCDVQCEGYLLKKYNRDIDEATLAVRAQNSNYWLCDLGTPLYNVGKLLEDNGLLVIRKYDADIDSLNNALQGCDGELKCDAIVIVNNDLLTGNEPEDYFADENPNHAVVPISIDKENGTIDLYNPSTGNDRDTYNLDLFIQSWSESKNYLVLVREKQYEFEYSPNPIDVSNVTLSPDLEELIDFIAENIHNVWAVKKFKENPGIRYAPLDENGKEVKGCNHFLRPYAELSDKDKEYDLDQASSTIKLLKRMGYRIVNVNDLHCCTECGEPIEMHHLYCSHCGRKLTWEDFK